MVANIIKRQTLEGIYSASGMQKIDGKLYIVCDNSPYLFTLNEKNFETINKIKLFEPQKILDGQIPKPIKPDFECLTQISSNTLLAIGSGSKKISRDVAYLINLNQDNTKQPQTRLDTSNLYNQLRTHQTILNGQKLNLEAAFTTQKHIGLMHRGNISGVNALFLYPKHDFLDALTQHKTLQPEVFTYELPSIKHRLSGFSAACITKNCKQILFACTAEDTNNEIDDGEILGSFVGFIDVDDLKNPLPKTVFIPDTTLKIEGICIKNQTPNSLTIYAVTDNDGTPSELLEIQILDLETLA